MFKFNYIHNVILIDNPFLIMNQTDQDSFEQYKTFLQEDLGISAVDPPPRPMSAYMRFCFERTSQEKSKGTPNLIQLTRSLGEEWKNLSAKKKQYYIKVYQIRSRERQQLQQQYEALSNNKKPITGYVKYYKMRFKNISKTNPTLQKAQIARMAVSDWKNLSQSEKTRYNEEAAEQQASKKLTAQEREDKINEYNERIKRFSEQLRQEKQKILKKYGLDSNRNEKKKAERINKRHAKILQIEVEKVKREEERKRKREEERQAKRLEKQLEKKKKQEQRLEKRKIEREKKAAEAVVKKQSKPKIRPAKAEAKAKTKKQKPTKTKKIKKAPKPKKAKAIKAKKTPKKATKVQVKKQVKEEVVNPPVTKKPKKTAVAQVIEKRTTRSRK